MDLFHRRPSGVGRHVDRCDRPAAGVAQRCGDRPQAHLQLLVDERPAPLAHLGEFGLECFDVGDRVLGERLEVLTDAGADVVGRQLRQEHPTHRGAVRRQPSAEAERDRHDPRRRDPRHVHDLAAVEDRDRGRLVHPLAQRFEERLADLLHVERREIGVADVQDGGGQREVAPVGGGVAQRRQREQQPPSGRPGEPRPLGDLRQRLFGMLGVEAAQHEEAAFEGLDMVRSCHQLLLTWAFTPRTIVR